MSEHGPEPPLLQIRGLVTQFGPDEAPVRAVNGVDLVVEAGQTVALVGESGSGKSVTSLSIMRLIKPAQGRVASGAMLFRGRDGVLHDLAALDEARMRNFAGTRSR